MSYVNHATNYNDTYSRYCALVLLFLLSKVCLCRRWSKAIIALDLLAELGRVLVSFSDLVIKTDASILPISEMGA
jgi:hypothetical protein